MSNEQMTPEELMDALLIPKTHQLPEMRAIVLAYTKNREAVVRNDERKRCADIAKDFCENAISDGGLLGKDVAAKIIASPT